MCFFLQKWWILGYCMLQRVLHTRSCTWLWEKKVKKLEGRKVMKPCFCKDRKMRKWSVPWLVGGKCQPWGYAWPEDFNNTQKNPDWHCAELFACLSLTCLWSLPAMFCLTRKAPCGLQGTLLDLKFPISSLLQFLLINSLWEELVLLCIDRTTATPRQLNCVVLLNFFIASCHDFTARWVVFVLITISVAGVSN